MKPESVSIIVPAYNEEARVRNCLDDILLYFSASSIDYEVLVVSDGSIDRTAEVVTAYSAKYNQIKLLEYSPNHGKGYAVKYGMLRASKQLSIFADADGSTPFAEFTRLLNEIEAGNDIAIGSRAMPSEHTRIKAKFHRRVIGRIFNFFLSRLLLPGIHDSQCGFKLFKSECAKHLFSMQKSEGFSFDYEILFLARKLGYSIKEVAVNWKNVDGSKVNLIADSLHMFIDIFRIRFWYLSIIK